MSQSRPTPESEFISATELPAVLAGFHFQHTGLRNVLINMAKQNLLRRAYIEVFQQKPMYLQELWQIATFDDETYQAILLNLPSSLAAISQERFMLTLFLNMQQKKIFTDHYIQLLNNNALFRDLLVEMNLRRILTADYITAFLNRHQTNWQEKIGKDFAYKQTVRGIALLHEKGFSTSENQHLVFNSIAPEECANALIALDKRTFTPEATLALHANLIKHINPVDFVAVLLQLAEADVLIPLYINLIAAAINASVVVNFFIAVKPDPLVLTEKLKINNDINNIAEVWDFFACWKIPMAYFDRTISLKKRPEVLLANLSKLNNAGILNDTNFTLISTIEYIIGGWLDEKNNLFSEETFQLIIHSLSPTQCGYAIYDLYANSKDKTTLYTVAHLKLLAMHRYPRELVKGLCHLEKNGNLSPQNVALLSTSSEPEKLARAIFTFHEGRLSTVVTVERIAQAKAPNLYAHAIESLHNNREFKNKVLSLTTNIDEVIFQHSQAWSLILVLKSFFHRGILTLEILQKSITYEQIENLQVFLENLDKLNIPIDNLTKLFDPTWINCMNTIINCLRFSQIETAPNVKALLACQDIIELRKRIGCSSTLHKLVSQTQFEEFLKPQQYQTQINAAFFTAQSTTQNVAPMDTETPRP